MEEKVKLFLEYMKKEKELTLEWDKEDGVDVDAPDYNMQLTTVGRVQAFIDYRNIRIEEAWYSKLSQGNNSRSVKERLNEYDAERSRKHSLALKSMNGFNMFGERYGLPKFYDGELLKASDIESYKNIPIRIDETNFFLQFVDKLNRTPGYKMQQYFEELGIEEGKEESKFLRELQSSVEKTDRNYGVEEPFVDDEADIKFKDDDMFNMR